MLGSCVVVGIVRSFGGHWPFSSVVVQGSRRLRRWGTFVVSVSVLLVGAVVQVSCHMYVGVGRCG